MTLHFTEALLYQHTLQVSCLLEGQVYNRLCLLEPDEKMRINPHKYLKE